MGEYKEWRANKKGKLMENIKKLLQTRTGYICIHCDRQYDDNICDICFAKMLVERFEETIKCLTA